MTTVGWVPVAFNVGVMITNPPKTAKIFYDPTMLYRYYLQGLRREGALMASAWVNRSLGARRCTA